MSILMTTGDVYDRYGFSRNSLLRWERDGVLHPRKTAGGHRRYTEKDILGAMKAGSKEKEIPVFGELGTSKISNWMQEEFTESITALKGSSGRKLYHKMRIDDPVISAVFFAIESSLKQSLWSVTPASSKAADVACAEWLDTCFHDMSYSWSDTVDLILTMLEQGICVLEPVYKRRLGRNPPRYIADPAKSEYSDGTVGWRKWAYRPLSTLASGNEWKIDDSGGIRGINQISKSNLSTFIPIERLLLFRTTIIPPQGIPIHRAMYVPYYYSKNFMEIEGIGVERDLTGIPVIYLGSDCTLMGEHSDFELAKTLVTNIRNDSQTGIVIPHAKMGTDQSGQGMLFELVASHGQRQHDVGAIIDRYDRLKALAVLAQFIMLGMQRVGSYALATSQSDLFTMSISAWLDKIASTINRIAIPRLMGYNVWPGISGYPHIQPSDIGIANLQQLASYINMLVGRKVIHPDQALEQHLRQVARLPGVIKGSESDPKYNLPTDTKETALILRRVLMGIKDLPSLKGVSDEQLTAMLKPLIENLRLSISADTGVDIPKID